MDFSNRPFRDEWLDPQQEAQPGDAPADVATPSREAVGPTPRAALTAARGVAPESLTFTQWLSKELVLPEHLVRQTPQQALEELRARQLETNPHLAAWAGKSVQNAAHARENVEYLNRFRDAFAAFDAAYRPQKEQSFAEFMDSLGKPGEKLLHAVTNDVPEVAQNVGRMLTHGMADVNAAFAGSALAVAENVFGRDSAPARWARSARDWAEWARPKKVQADTALGQFGYDALRIAPQMAATIAAAVANPVAAAGVMGSQIFGSSYNELRGKGVSPLSAALNAGANTALQLPMERFGLEKLLRAIRTTGTKEALKNWIGAAFSEGLTEGAQKAPEFVTHLWAQAERQGSTTGERVDWFVKQVTDADNLMQAFHEAWYEGLLGAVWGGGLGAVGAGRSFRQGPARGGEKTAKKTSGILASPEIRELVTAEAEQAGLMAQRQALGNALTQAASALEDAPAANDPAAMREMTEAVLPEQFRQTWIAPDDAARLFQEAQARGEGEAAALLETLGTDEAGLAQAAEQGDVLPVSTAAVLAQLRGDGRAAVLDALRVTPDGVSGTEAAAYDPEARAEKLVRSVLGMEEEGGDGGRDAGDALREARSAQKVRADVAREITRITQEIEAAGYPRHAAQTFARLLEHQAITAHTVYGVDPVSFILQRVSVARGEQAADGGLGQAAMYPARDADLSSFISRVREESRGEKPSYFALTGEGIPEDAEVRVTSDLIRHQGKRHPDMTLEDNERLPAIVAGINGENTKQLGGRWTYGTRFRGMQEVDGTTYGYVFDIAANGTVSIVTFFKDAPKQVRNWFLETEKEKKKASKASVDPAEAGTHNPNFYSLASLPEMRLSDFIAEVKEKGPQLFQRAYHGTPHRFDQFTLDHMGSGEGAQAHGWGLYFAADKNVSEEYRKRLGSIKYYDGKRELGGMEARAARFLLDGAGKKRPLAEAEAEVRKYTDPGAEQDQLLTHVRDLMEKDVTRKKGQLYEVDIPENDELLDEQKTLAEQAGRVKEALERGADSMPDDEIEANMAEYLYQALDDGANVTGRKLYQALAQLGTVDYEETLEISSDGARAASEFLNSLGIKGITYVGHEDGRCFVVFDDKAISILNTFYQKRKPVEVSSKALGVPEGSDIREYRKAAKKYHDRLKEESKHGKPVIQPDLARPVRFFP